MTSPFPMMTGSLLSGNVGYFINCFTDIDGYVEKINKVDTGPWIPKYDSSSQCFDVKLNYAKYNLFYKNIDISTTNHLDTKSLYVVNSLKMPLQFCANEYSKYFNKNISKSDKIVFYKQEAAEVFERDIIISDKYTIVLFITSSLESKPFIYKFNNVEEKIFPLKGSLLIIPPGVEFQINQIYNENHYYAVYEFSDII